MAASFAAKVEKLSGSHDIRVDVEQLVIAGWAGRDVEAMEHHIQELEALGVKRPRQTPTFYRVAASRLTPATRIEELGTASSGEAETVLVAHEDGLLVGLGSDHTDREVETYGVSVSKQLCAKPIASAFWAFEDVAPHWDELILRSFIVENGERVLYQEGSVSSLQTPLALTQQYAGKDSLPPRTAMFGGTLPAIGGIRNSSEFEAELEDPVLGRRLTLRYEVESLEDVG